MWQPSSRSPVILHQPLVKTLKNRQLVLSKDVRKRFLRSYKITSNSWVERWFFKPVFQGYTLDFIHLGGAEFDQGSYILQLESVFTETVWSTAAAALTRPGRCLDLVLRWILTQQQTIRADCVKTVKTVNDKFKLNFIIMWVYTIKNAVSVMYAPLEEKQETILFHK